VNRPYPPGREAGESPRIELVQFDLTEELVRKISNNSEILQMISPDKFEDVVHNRLEAMGLSVQRIGNTNRKDGGIDFVFFPKTDTPFPFLGAVQVKHHRKNAVKTGASDVRDFVGAVAGPYFQTGLLITNTTFSPDAKWFASKHEPKVRLRDFQDLVRWFAGNFNAEAEWREIPDRIELCPGFFVDLKIPARKQGN
jgi:restriction endonuclease Mrr